MNEEEEVRLGGQQDDERIINKCRTILVCSEQGPYLFHTSILRVLSAGGAFSP